MMIFRSSSTSMKLRLLVAALLFATAMLTACGPGEDSGADPESAADATDERARESPSETNGSGEEPDGVITATFNGTERTWYITSAERSGQFVSQSDWSSYSASHSGVSIMGHVSPSWPFRSAEAIMIGFTLQGTGENPSVGDPSITYLSGGITNNHSSDHDGNANISVTSASIDGETLTISGNFSGMLPFKSMSGDADVESTETIVVENGTFEGEVRRLQDG